MDTDFHYKLMDFEFEYKDSIYDDYTTLDIVKRCETFSFRSDDIVIFSFPRTGTTVTSELMWQVLNHKVVEKDAKFGSLEQRFTFMELNPKFEGYYSPSAIDELERKPTTKPRLIKTHLPYSIFREQIEKVNPKVVIVLRDPKDSAIALYHFQKSIRQDMWPVSFSEFLPCFLHGKSSTGDFFTNYIDWWALRDRPNVLILRYEDILSNRHQQVRTLAGFFGVEVPPEKVDAIVHNTSFGTMSKNEQINIDLNDDKHKFLRKGKSGDWRNVLTVAQNETFNRVMEKRLCGTGLTFIS